jgi:hypothetical protein
MAETIFVYANADWKIKFLGFIPLTVNRRMDQVTPERVADLVDQLMT